MTWCHVHPEECLEVIYVLTKLNCKVYANIVESTRNTQRFTVVLYTGAGSSFVRLHDLPLNIRKKIQKLGGSVNIRNAIEKTHPIVGTVRLTVQIGTSVEHVNTSTVPKNFQHHSYSDATSVTATWNQFIHHVLSSRWTTAQPYR